MQMRAFILRGTFKEQRCRSLKTFLAKTELIIIEIRVSIDVPQTNSVAIPESYSSKKKIHSIQSLPSFSMRFFFFK